MKSININGREFQYEVEEDAGEYGSSYETKFYEGLEQYFTRKYIFWGEKTYKTRPKFAFNVYFNIEDNFITKQELRKKLERALELLQREKEIELGNLI